MSVQFDWAALNNVDRDKFYQGRFKVVVLGGTADGFDKADAEADLQLSFTFSPYE